MAEEAPGESHAEKQDAFAADYGALCTEAQASEAKIFFVEGAYPRADVDLRPSGFWGANRMSRLTSPWSREKATYYSGACLEMGEAEYRAVTEHCTAQTSVAFLEHVRKKHGQLMIVIWDNGPAHRGLELREYRTTPALQQRSRPCLLTSPTLMPTRPSDWTQEEVWRKSAVAL